MESCSDDQLEHVEVPQQGKPPDQLEGQENPRERWVADTRLKLEAAQYVNQVINKFLDERMNLRPEHATTGPQKKALSLPVVRDLDWRFSALRDKKLPRNPRANKILAMIGQQRGLQIDDLPSKCNECQQDRGAFSTCVIAKMPTKEGTPAQLIGSGACMSCYFENKTCFLRNSTAPEVQQLKQSYLEDYNTEITGEAPEEHGHEHTSKDEESESSDEPPVGISKWRNQLIDDEAEEATTSEDQDQDLSDFVVTDSESIKQESLSSEDKVLQDAEAELESSSEEVSSPPSVTVIPMVNPARWMVPGQSMRIYLSDSLRDQIFPWRKQDANPSDTDP